MKTNLLIVILVIIFLSNIKAQKSSNTIDSLPPNEQVISIDKKSGIKNLWLDSEIYEYAKIYNLQDSLFENQSTIKKGYTLLRAYPKIELDKYFDQKVKSIQSRKDWKMYADESVEFHKNVKFVNNTNDYIKLLNRFPLYKAEIIKFYEKQPEYKNFENQLLSSEIRIGVFPDKKEIIIVPKKYKDIPGREKLLPIK